MKCRQLHRHPGTDTNTHTNSHKWTSSDMYTQKYVVFSFLKTFARYHALKDGKSYALWDTRSGSTQGQLAVRFHYTYLSVCEEPGPVI